MSSRFNFSVIMPVYNAEKYLYEAINSLLAQSLNFKENIQLILVDDGSSDSSAAICREYRKKYPKNIIYIRQKNAGVSAARNAGLERAAGKYINFLDSDDKWATDVFERVLEMFESHDEVAIIGVRQKFFDAQDGRHVLDYKFDADKVVDVMERYDHIQLSATSAFIRVEAIRNMSFDVDLKYAEDAKLIAQIIMTHSMVGFIASTDHYYRKRADHSSAMQNALQDRGWYITTLQKSYMELAEESIHKFGYVIPYVQYLIAYELQWRVSIEPTILSKAESREYRRLFRKLVSLISDKIWREQRFISKEDLEKVMHIKHPWRSSIKHLLSRAKNFAVRWRCKK